MNLMEKMNAARAVAFDPMADQPSPSDLARFDKARQEWRRATDIPSVPAPRQAGFFAAKGRMADVLAAIDAALSKEQ